MKAVHFFSTTVFILYACTIHAQTDVLNAGTLYVGSATDTLYISGAFNNASGAGFINNGNLYVLKDISNGQSSMTAGTGTLYLNGAAAQAVSGTQQFRTFNLVTNNNNGIALNNDLSVSGVHTFMAGILTSSATPNYLIYEAGSSFTGDADTRHVKGWVRKTGATAFSFPVGNGTVERTIGVSNLSASSSFNVNYAGATSNTSNVVVPLLSVDPNEYWIVNRISGGTASIDMNWNNSKIAMPHYTLSDIRVANYIAGNWTQVGGSATGNVLTTGNISSGTLSSFGSFVLGSISFLLPVNIVQFSASNNNGNAVINWISADELNIAFYSVQRSDDGLLFYEIGKLPAYNLPGLQQYHFTDNKSLQDITYYRLASTDADGKTKLSGIVNVSNHISQEKHLAVVNPAHGSIRLKSQNLDGIFAYRVNTIAGQNIQQGSIRLSTGGMNFISLSAAVRNGWYVLQIERDGFSYSERVLIQ